MQGMGHEAGLRIPSSRAGMPLVGAGRLQLAGWWAWGLKATITHKVRYNTPAPRAHTTGIPAPGLRCRSKWHGRPNPLPGAVRAAWCPCPYACMPRPMPPMPVPWLRPCAVCIYTGEHPRGGGYVGVGTAAHQATLVCVVSVYTPQGTCVSWLDTAHGACTAHKLFSLFSS